MPVHPLVLLHSSLPLRTAQLGLKPAAHALAIGWPRGGGDVVHKVAEPLPQRHHAQALALAGSVPHRVELCPECLTDRGRNGHEFLRELEERVAETMAETRTREKGAHALGRAVKPVDQDSSDPIRRLLLGRRALKHLIRLGKGCGTGLRRIAQVPEDTAADNRGEIHFLASITASATPFCFCTTQKHL